MEYKRPAYPGDTRSTSTWSAQCLPFGKRPDDRLLSSTLEPMFHLLLGHNGMRIAGKKKEKHFQCLTLSFRKWKRSEEAKNKLMKVRRGTGVPSLLRGAGSQSGLGWIWKRPTRSSSWLLAARTIQILSSCGQRKTQNFLASPLSVAALWLWNKFAPNKNSDSAEKY